MRAESGAQVTINEIERVMDHAYSHLTKGFASCHTRAEDKGIDDAQQVLRAALNLARAEDRLLALLLELEDCEGRQ
jgi:hypothetical protein